MYNTGDMSFVLLYKKGKSSNLKDSINAQMIAKGLAKADIVKEKS